MHGDHPAGSEIAKCANGVLRTGVNIAERGWIIRTNWQQRDLGTKALSDFMEAIEVGGIASVVNGVLAMRDDVATESAVHIANDTSTPVPGGRMGNGQAAMVMCLPPLEFDDLAETEIGNQIANVTGDDKGRGLPQAAAVTCDRTQGGTMEVVEMSVGNQHDVDPRQITDA